MRFYLPVAIFLIIPIVWLLTYFGLNYSGFCFSTFGYLSEEEKVRIVFNYQNSRSSIPIEKETVRHLQYSSFEEYLNTYPDCCNLNSGGPYGVPPENILDRIFGYESNDVVVTDFNVRYRNKKGQINIEQVRFENVLTNCGDVKY